MNIHGFAENLPGFFLKGYHEQSQNCGKLRPAGNLFNFCGSPKRFFFVRAKKVLQVLHLEYPVAGPVFSVFVLGGG